MGKITFYKQQIVVLFVVFFIVSPVCGQYRVFTIGDSTVQDYNEGYSPRKGWGQMLPFFFDLNQIDIINKVGQTHLKFKQFFPVFLA